MSQPKILIVDDDTDMRRALHVRLRAHGYETAFASDGLTATNVALKEVPDLILLDLGLPAGDGFVVMNRFRNNSELSAIPIIVLTAREAQENAEAAFSAGCFAFFQKPADNNALMNTIERALGQPDVLMS
jgi:CheY-like chemotaxis protein